MWCCWISRDRNPASTSGRSVPNISAARVFRPEAQVSIRLMLASDCGRITGYPKTDPSRPCGHCVPERWGR
jgi:hypothetical protein